MAITSTATAGKARTFNPLLRLQYLSCTFQRYFPCTWRGQL